MIIEHNKYKLTRKVCGIFGKQRIITLPYTYIHRPMHDNNGKYNDCALLIYFFVALFFDVYQCFDNNKNTNT